MPKVTIYHNPRCTKSRQSLALLEKHDIELEVVEYLKMPLSYATLKNILEQLNITAHELLRKKEQSYTTLNLSELDTEDTLINAMINYPILIERPIIIHVNRAVIGRPPEKILEIL